MSKSIKISLIVILFNIGFFTGNLIADASTATATCLSTHAGFCSEIGLTMGIPKTVNYENAKSKLEAYYNKWSAVLAWSYMRHDSGNTYYWTCVNTDVIRFVRNCGSYGDCSVTCGGGTQSDLCGNTKKCNTHSCVGTCGSANGGSYTYPDNSFTDTQFCSPTGATPSPNPVPFPVLVGANPSVATSSWTCHTLEGTDGNTCSVTLQPPTVSCGTKSNDTVINTTPTDPGLCGGDCNTSTVQLNASGEWEWECAHNTFSGIVATGCSRPTCLSEDLLNYESTVYLQQDPNNQTITVSVSCNDLTPDKICCDIAAVEAGSNPVSNSTHICTGEGEKEIVIPASGNYPAQCYFVPPADPTCENDGSCPNPKTKTVGVTTMCSQRECNAQGTCQSTPIAATSLNECSSTCNSNADCSSGRIIETRP